MEPFHGYTYDKDRRETKTTLGKVTRETAYDAWGRVKAQDWKNDGSQIFHVSYEYPDSGKNIIGLPTKIVNGGVATEYTYDANGNITSATENRDEQPSHFPTELSGRCRYGRCMSSQGQC